MQLLASLLVNPRLDSVLRGAVAAVQANALTPLYALPTAVRRRLAGPPIQIDGNTLDPELQLLLRVKALLPDTTKSDAAVARAHLKYLCVLVAGRPVELQRVTELTVRGADDPAAAVEEHQQAAAGVARDVQPRPQLAVGTTDGQLGHAL